MKLNPFNITCIVPIKSLRTAKSRLASVLGDEARVRLVLKMLRHTLEVLDAVPTIKHKLVLSPDDRVGELAASLGADFLLEPDVTGLNVSLDRAREEIRRSGAEALLILPGDLPLLTAADVELLLVPGRSGANLILAPDCGNKGTNALYTSPIINLPFCFGEGSLGKHIEGGCRMGADVMIIRTPNLGMDVDTPEDFFQIIPLTILRAE